MPHVADQHLSPPLSATVDAPDPKRTVGAEPVQAWIEALVRGAYRELLLLDPGIPGPEVPQGSRADGDPAVRAIRPNGSGPPGGLPPAVRGPGAEVRAVPALPVLLVLADRKTAVVAWEPDQAGVEAIVSESPGLMTALGVLLEAVRRTAVPVEDPTGLSHQERLIIEMLDQGWVDEVIARRLGVSVRTCRGAIAALMVRLGARSRFQAGARAQARGWIDA